MAVPKRKTSKSRRNKRRSHHRISSVNIIEDKKSGEFRLSHHVDLKTGVYNGKQIIEPKKQYYICYMSNKVKIAIDAMSGENAPEKIIEGIKISLNSNKENFFYLYGDENLLKKKISENKLLNEHCEIIVYEQILGRLILKY